MNKSMEEMRYFLEVIQAYTTEAPAQDKEVLTESQGLEEQKQELKEELEEEVLTGVLGELRDLKESWLSYTSNEEDPNTAEGVEKGLFKASEMLENLLETKYGRRL